MHVAARRRYVLPGAVMESLLGQNNVTMEAPIQAMVARLFVRWNQDLHAPVFHRPYVSKCLADMDQASSI
jgi:hypothetical protein